MLIALLILLLPVAHLRLLVELGRSGYAQGVRR